MSYTNIIDFHYPFILWTSLNISYITLLNNYVEKLIPVKRQKLDSIEALTKTLREIFDWVKIIKCYDYDTIYNQCIDKH